MIDITKLTSEELKELREALGLTKYTKSRKAQFWSEVEDELRFIKAKKRMNGIEHHEVREDIINHLTALTDFVTHNYGLDRRYGHFGRSGGYGRFYPENESNYKEFAQGVVELIKKHYVEEEWEIENDKMRHQYETQ